MFENLKSQFFLTNRYILVQTNINNKKLNMHNKPCNNILKETFVTNYIRAIRQTKK